MSPFRYNMMQMAILSAVSILDHETPETAVAKRGNTAHQHYFKYTRDGMMHCPLPHVHVPDDVRDACIADSRAKRLARFKRNCCIHILSPARYVLPTKVA